MKKHVLSILVENHPGVLSRISGLYRRLGINVDSFASGVTDNPEITRITIVGTGDENIIEQLIIQLNMLMEIIKVRQMNPLESISRELILFKISATANTRSEIIQIVNIFRANIVDVSVDTLTIELVGAEQKIEAFMDIVKQFGIISLARTGTIALERGNNNIKAE